MIFYGRIDEEGYINGFSDKQDNEYNALFEIDESSFEEFSACSGNCFKIEDGRAVKKKDLDEYLSDWEQKREKAERIMFLKKSLIDTDYKAIKFAEGLISAEEYEAIKIERQLWRHEINILEGEIQGG